MMRRDGAPGEGMTGTVSGLKMEKGYGFITGDDGIEYFFHRTDSPVFDRLAPGLRVAFTMGGGAKGPRAVSVTVEE